MYDKLPDKYKQVCSEARWNQLCELVKSKGMSISNRDLTTSEIQLVIDETALSDNQRKGAILYYIHHVKIKDLQERFGYDKSGILYYKKKISLALRQTCNKIFVK